MGTFARSRSNKFIMYEFIRLIMNTYNEHRIYQVEL